MSANPKPLVLAIPSKGRLQDNVAAFFSRIGLTVAQSRGARDYRARLNELFGVEVALLSAAEIVQQLAAGTVHLGITGEDLVREMIPIPEEQIEFLAPLGFGRASLVVAVPQAWIDVRTMADLEDVAATFHTRRGTRIRVATKYINQTRRYFAQLGVTDYRIVESLGATEGAPASGTAEFIVDITSTGATLRSNELKVLDDGVILRSEANLMASITAAWDNEKCATARAILSRIDAEEAARLNRCVTALVPNALELMPEVAKHFDARALFGLYEEGPLRLVCSKEKAPFLADWLIEKGAQYVGIDAHEYLFSAASSLYERLVRRIGQRHA